MWKFYGVFTALAVAGCVLGAVGASIQLSDDFGVLSLLYYFEDKRVFGGDDSVLRSTSLDPHKIVGTLQKFAARIVFVAGEFFFFSVAKILVAHRLATFVRLGRSERAIRAVAFIDRLVLAVVLILSSLVLILSFATSYYYALAGNTAQDGIARKNFNSSDVAQSISQILDSGNYATTAMHFAMCTTLLVAFTANLASAAAALRGIRSIFTAEALAESSQVRGIRRQILGFCASVLAAYVVQFTCAHPPSKISFHYRV